MNLIFRDTYETSYGLCEGRHEMPVDKFIFPNTIAALDIDRMERTAIQVLEKEFRGKPLTYLRYSVGGSEIETAEKVRGILNLYVSGLSTAQIAVFNACRLLSIKCVIWHYSIVDKVYIQQILV